MNYGTVRRNGSRKVVAKYATVRRQGHNDMLAGRGFPAEYDTWPTTFQRNYENARLVAANMKAAGFTPPRWNDGVTVPRAYKTFARMAMEKHGPASQLRPQPADESLSFTSYRVY